MIVKHKLFMANAKDIPQPFIIDFSRSDWEKQTIWTDEPGVLKIKSILDDWLAGKNLVLQSSGSTGDPKSCTFTREQVNASCNRTLKLLHAEKGETMALALPVDFTGGRMVVLRALLGKLKLLCWPPALELNFHGYPVNHISVVPPQLAANAELLQTCDTILVGGAELSPETEAYPWKPSVLHTYGMTEALSHVAIRQLGNTNVYRALHGVSFSQDDRGCLVIDDNILGIKHLKTNDLVTILDNLTFQYEGRADEVINSGGVKIPVKQWIHDWCSLNDTPIRLASLPHKKFGQQLIMLVRDTIDEEKVLSDIKEFPKVVRPRAVYLVSQWPETPLGKPKIFLRDEDISELAGRKILTL
jgi:o-succinylbenzoate---CoA ligase